MSPVLALLAFFMIVGAIVVYETIQERRLDASERRWPED